MLKMNFSKVLIIEESLRISSKRSTQSKKSTIKDKTVNGKKVSDFELHV